MQYLSSATVSPGACSVSRSSMRNRSPPTARPPPPPPPPPAPLTLPLPPLLLSRPRRDEEEDDEDVLVTEGHIHRRPRLDAAPETLTTRRIRAGQKRQDKTRIERQVKTIKTRGVLTMCSATRTARRAPSTAAALDTTKSASLRKPAWVIQACIISAATIKGMESRLGYSS